MFHLASWHQKDFVKMDHAMAKPLGLGGKWGKVIKIQWLFEDALPDSFKGLKGYLVDSLSSFLLVLVTNCIDEKETNPGSSSLQNISWNSDLGSHICEIVQSWEFKIIQSCSLIKLAPNIYIYFLGNKPSLKLNPSLSDINMRFIGVKHLCQPYV